MGELKEQHSHMWPQHFVTSLSIPIIASRLGRQLKGHLTQLPPVTYTQSEGVIQPLLEMAAEAELDFEPAPSVFGGCWLSLSLC